MKVKKILISFLVLFLLCGCTNIKELNYDEILNTLSINNLKANTSNKGYKFYTPKGLSITEKGNNYAILTGNRNIYYLYVDLISYYNKKNLNYQESNNALYSTSLSNDGKSGYAEIKLLENNKYLIEIMYNYAKIEVMVDREFINEALINIVAVLKSIEYNDTIIEDLLNDDNLNYTEEVFDMFKDIEDNSNILDYEENGIYEEQPDEENKDTDYVS